MIKNVPFTLKKESLIQNFTEMDLPLPLALNYDFDDGVFPGLAFATFISTDETATVIERLNHFEIHGRKLRVEYKRRYLQAFVNLETNRQRSFIPVPVLER
jgi:RNA recognition motif-containing protein